METYEKLEDLHYLIQNNISENKQLEYKAYCFEGGKISAGDRDALVKEIVAMANSLGGHIIIGIKEIKRDNTLRLIGVSCPNLDEFERTIQHSIYARIKPRLYGVRVSSITIDADRIAIIVSVPQSYNKPHAYHDGSKHEFWIRQSNSIINMTVDDLRQQFHITSSYKQMIQRFRQERINDILLNDKAERFIDGAKLIIHIIPLWSLIDGNNIDLKTIQVSRLDSPLYC